MPVAKKWFSFALIQVLVASFCTLAAQPAAQVQDSLRRLLAQGPADTVRVNLLNKLARSYLTSNQDSLLMLAQAAIDLSEKIHYPRGEADALVHMCICYRVKGDYPMALDDGLKGISLLEGLRADAVITHAYLQIAQVYKEMSGPNRTSAYIDKGTHYIRLSLGRSEVIRDTVEIVEGLNMLGIFFFDKGKDPAQRSFCDTAFEAYKKALSLIDASGDKYDADRGKLYNNISQVYLEYKQDYQKALEFSFMAVDFNKAHHNLPSLTFNYNNISGAYAHLRDFPKALFYARQMLEVAQAVKRPERIQNAYHAIYEAYKAAGQTDSAFSYYILADMLNDSLTNTRKTQQVMDLQTKYETVKKEGEITRLQLEGSNKNRQILLLLVAALLLGGVAAAMIWLYRRVVGQRRQIAEQSVKLEVMMKELHHRVKNNLQIVSSLLGLQIYKLQDEGTISVLKESQLRVQAMSFIHQRLYKNETLTAVNMKEYLTDLMELLLSTYGFQRDGFDLAIRTNTEMLDIDQALPIGLIINEMATNALKYAYGSVARPSLAITITDSARELVFVVRDNGIGLDTGKWEQKSVSFGKQLIKALCKQLRAEQQLIIDSGTAFTITIPKQAA